MATVITKTVHTSGADYSSMGTWDSGATTVYGDDLVSNDVIWKGEFIGLGTYTAHATMGGATTDATRYKWLTVSSGNEWFTLTGSSRIGGMLTGYGRQMTSGSGNFAVTMSENYAVLENIVMQSNSVSAATAFFSISGTDCVVRNCYLRKNSTNSATTALVVMSGQRSIFINNFVELAGTSTGEEAIELSNGSSADDSNVPVIANNTFLVTSTDSGGSAASARGTAIYLGGLNTRYVRVVNNAFIGFASLFSGSATRIFATGSGNNMTTIAAGSTEYTDLFPGSGNIYGGDITGTWSNSNNVLVNTTYAAGDMRAYSTGVLANAGAAVTTPTHPIGAGGATQYAGLEDLDAYGNARNPTTPWIGAWEDAYSGGGGAGPSTHFMLRRKR